VILRYHHAHATSSVTSESTPIADAGFVPLDSLCLTDIISTRRAANSTPTPANSQASTQTLNRREHNGLQQTSWQRRAFIERRIAQGPQSAINTQSTKKRIALPFDHAVEAHGKCLIGNNMFSYKLLLLLLLILLLRASVSDGQLTKIFQIKETFLSLTIYVNF